MRITRSAAFTLIEVLITVIIIGILFSVTSYIFGNAEQRSRDQQRISNLATIDNGLEQYHLDNHSYPQVGINGNNIFTAKFQLEAISGCGFTGPTGKGYLAPLYLGTVPDDPTFRTTITGSGTSCYTNQYGQYLYVTVTTDPNIAAQSFYLMARMERATNYSPTAPTSAQLGYWGGTIFGGGSPLLLCDKTTNAVQLASCTQNYYRTNNPN